MVSLTLHILNGATAGQTLAVPPEGATLGRTRVADIRLEDALLSRVHCRFDFDSEGPTLQDLGSSNGTSLNGKPLEGPPAHLHEGDVITVGETQLRVEVVGAESAASAPTLAVRPPQASFPASAAPTPPVPPPPLPEMPPLPQAAPAPLPPDLPQAPATPVNAPAPAPGSIDLLGLKSPAAPAAESARAPQPAAPVDLGLKHEADEKAAQKRNPLLPLILALSAIFVLILGAGLIFTLGSEHNAAAKQPPKALVSAENLPFEFSYERLQITPNSIFRYRLTYEHDGTLAVDRIDLGGEERKVVKQVKLAEKARADLSKLLLSTNYAEIPSLLLGQSPDGLSLDQQRLTIVRGSTVWTREAENSTNASFNALVSRLEDFASAALDLLDLSLSTEELQQMCEERLRVARRYWEQRDLTEEKLYLAVQAYREANAYLETLNPKPTYAKDLEEELVIATQLLDERYDEAAFAVQQAKKTNQYAKAAEFLRKIMKMIPSQEDDRYRQASNDLLLIETHHLKKGARR